MRFPHTILIEDPRNRRPPEGASYVASNYDYLRLGGKNLKSLIGSILDDQGDEIELDEDVFSFSSAEDLEKTKLTKEEFIPAMNKFLAEPKGSKPVSVEVECLVTMVDDGNRNLDQIAYSVRVPKSEVDRATAYLKQERLNSLTMFGYTRPEQQVYVSQEGYRLWRGSSDAIPEFGRGADAFFTVGTVTLSSHINRASLPIGEFSIRGTGRGTSPIDNRTLSGVADFKATQTGNIYNRSGRSSGGGQTVDFYEFELIGTFPPVIEWFAVQNSLRTLFPCNFNKKKISLGEDVSLGSTFFCSFGEDPNISGLWGYEYNLFINRVDTYPDVTDFRCSAPNNVL